MEIEFFNVSKKATIIDIRYPSDYENYHLDNTINVTRINLLKNPDKYLSKEKENYLLCDKGTVSMSCAKILNALGYNCKSIKGGMEGIKN